MHRLEDVLACPACHGPLDQLHCRACDTRLERDGWLLDAVGTADLPAATRSRFEAYGKPLAARVYDLDVRLTSRVLYGASVGLQAAFLAEALDAAAALDRPVLDVPGGSGIVLARALKRAGRRPPLVVADLSVTMLARTRARIGDDALYVRADVGRLPFAAGAFGAVHSGNGFHLFPDPSAAATELARVTATEGAAFATTWVLAGRWPAEQWMRLLARRGVCNEACSREHFEDLFADAGLHEVRSHTNGSLLLWHGRPAAWR